jgi:outer membrane protein
MQNTRLISPTVPFFSPRFGNGGLRMGRLPNQRSVSVVKKSILTVAMVAMIAGITGQTTTTFAQDAASKSIPHKVGLIDMAEVFKNYKKFEVMRESLKSQIEASDTKAKTYATRLKKISDEMKTFKEGSDARTLRENELLKVSADFDAFRKGAQRDLMREESKIYKTIYLETTDMVTKFAGHYNYTLIIRFQRSPVDEAEKPGAVIQSMNRQIVFFRPEDDITKDILYHLNTQYKKSGGAVSRNASNK